LKIADELLRVAKGEVLSDDWSRQVYSVDASHYQLTPQAVVCPKDDGDVQHACEYSRAKKVPLVARGAGTGLLGQSLSDGVILDFTKHMNKIVEIGDDFVIVQPGIVKAVLDKELKKKDKFLPPDPASSNYCTVGGMIADNSSGVHCLGYGNTIDFLEQVDVVYADGRAGHASSGKFDDRMATVKKLLSPFSNTIQKAYPKVSKNSCGYRLDAVMNEKFAPQKLFAASEGTLGIVTRAQLRILDIPEYRGVAALGFEDLLAAVAAVPLILKLSPVALEMLDHTVFLHGGNSSEKGCVLFVEFAGGDRQKVEKSLELCRQSLAGKTSVLESASDEQSIARIWRARKGALNSIMKMTVGSRKPIGLIEDTVVRPDLLADHVSGLLQTYRDNRLDYVMYGHVGDGNLHTRPVIDIASESQVELMDRIAKSVFGRVIKSGGTITGEHGDGIARSCYIEMMYGSEMTSIFAAVKRLLDPGFTLNPGKKVPAMIKNGA
jgi:glycolate oxidase